MLCAHVQSPRTKGVHSLAGCSDGPSAAHDEPVAVQVADVGHDEHDEIWQRFDGAQRREVGLEHCVEVGGQPIHHHIEGVMERKVIYLHPHSTSSFSYGFTQTIGRT